MKVFNTLSGQKEEFHPGSLGLKARPEGDEVKMYVCGVTPYSDSHIGHAMSYILFDVVRRYLTYRGYKVKHVQNITDIDDKIINRANQTGVTAGELAEKFSNSFLEDMDALNVQRADVYPRATGEIPKIIEIVQGLIDNGYAYHVSNGDVYFRVTKAEGYGKLAHRTLDSMMAGARIEVGEEKENPMDFTLWKASKPGEPSWNSPWGPGRPGWHIECSAMSLKYLGTTLDIHGGGHDLVFPHHENEIAQSESFTGVKPFVKYWMHNGLLQLSGEKMSKSLGNLITIKDALKKYSADALRIFVLSSHYRSPLTYSPEIVESAERGADRLRQVAASSPTGTGKASQIHSEPAEPIDANKFRDSFISAMDDDFNSAQAMGILFDLAREINRRDDEGADTNAARRVFRELADVLGLTLKPAEAEPLDVKALSGVCTDIYQALGRSGMPDETQDTEVIMANLINLRAELRKAKQYQQADLVRNKLDEAGIILEDTPKGTVWKRRR